MSKPNPRPALTKKLKNLDTITLVGVVEDFDDDHVSIDLNPCSLGDLIIVPRSAVDVSEHKKIDCPSGETVQLSTIKAKKNTPIMKMQAGILCDEVLVSLDKNRSVMPLGFNPETNVQPAVQSHSSILTSVQVYVRNTKDRVVGCYQHTGSGYSLRGMVSPGQAGYILANSDYIFVVAIPGPDNMPAYGGVLWQGLAFNGQSVTV